MESISIQKGIQPFLKCKAFQRGQNLNSFQLFHASFWKKMSWILSVDDYWITLLVKILHTFGNYFVLGYILKEIQICLIHDFFEWFLVLSVLCISIFFESCSDLL